MTDTLPSEAPEEYASMNDWKLLRRYVENDSQEAFAALTERYLGLVYSVCRREMDDTETAEDVTQAVFLILARKAPTLGRNVVLSGWLFQTARFAAKNARLQAQRRAAYEQKAAEAMQQESKGREDATWSEIEPLLNPALAALREADRQCVLLRFFQGLSFAEAGTVLGLSEEAARKRVTRALEKMRRFFEKGGVIVPGVAFAALLSAHAAKAAPAHIGGVVSQSVAGVIPGSVSQLLEGMSHAMKIARLKTAGAAAVALLALAVYPILTHARSAGGIKPHIVRQVPPVASPGIASPIVPPKNATLTGRVVYADGRPVAGVQVAVGLQSKAEADLTSRTPEADWGAISAISGTGDTTKPDGSYHFEVAANLPYNVMVDMTKPGAEDDRAVQWVAAANEGVSGKAGKTTPLPDLVLTRGVFVTGLVTDKASGRPLAGVHIGSHGPHRPFTTGMITGTDTDPSGHYRLRLAPGKGEVYIADGRYNGFFDEEARAKKLIVLVTTSKGHPATVDFQVTPSKP